MSVLIAVWGVATVLLPIPGHAGEGTSSQLWANVIFGFPAGDHFQCEIKIQPKIQVSDGEEWRYTGLTGLVEYYPNAWVDLLAELKTGYTVQTMDMNSFELAPRIGARLHFVQQIVDRVVESHSLSLERVPSNRFDLAALVRLEYRNVYFDNEIDSSHELRLRFRPEFKVAINNPNLRLDKTLFFQTDVEFFEPVTDDVAERFSNKVRFRGGFGYRISYEYRFSLLYLYDLNRDSSLEDFGEDASMLEFNLKILF